MENFSKKTLLNYVNGAGLFGSASAGQTVKFAYTENIAKVGTADNGTITFYADTTNKTGIIAVGGDVVSSKILNVTSTAVNNGKTGENTITVTFFNAATKATDTITFDVVNAAAAKAYFEDYFTNSDTISIANGTANVNVDASTILIDATNNYIKSGLQIAYVAETASTGAKIQLQDAHGVMLSEIAVGDIVGDGVLVDSIYHDDTGILELRFGNGQVYDPTKPATYTKVEVDLKKVIDWNDFLIGAQSDDYLEITPSVDSSVITLNTKMQDVSTASASATGLADAWNVKQYVDSKSQDLGVTASGDIYVDASVAASDNKHINVAATDKTKTAVALAETALQGINKTATEKTYVDLTVGTKTVDGSTQSLEIVETALVQKFVDVDASIDDLQAKDIEIDGSIGDLKAKDIEIDGSIGDLKAKDIEIDSSITGIKDAIAAMDASIQAETANHDISIYLAETDGVVTTVGVEHTAATVTYTPADGATPANLEGSGSFVMGSDIAAIKNYVDAVSGSLDSSVTDTDNFVTVKTTQTNGALSAQDVTVVTADISAGPGAIDVRNNGIVTGAILETAIENAITWINLDA